MRNLKMTEIQPQKEITKIVNGWDSDGVRGTLSA